MRSEARASMLAVFLLRLVTDIPSVQAARVQTDRMLDQQHVSSEEEDKVSLTDSSQTEAQVGLVLRDRYVLTRFIETRGKISTISDANATGVPGVSFPGIKRRGLSHARHLGTGSFGDVWAAHDKQLNKEVAVKIFYRSVQGRKRYATWGLAKSDRRLHEELENNIKECSLIKEIVGNSRMYPVGASRICRCFDEHISDVRRQPDRVVFLVQEMCGKSLEDEFLEKHQKRGTRDVPLARSIVKQMLEGVAYLNMFRVPMIHHDLKPANVVINNGDVKIIDWGGLVFATPQNMYKPAVGTPLYTPPEAERGTSFYVSSRGEGAYAYDVYAIGLMFMEFVCPSLQRELWYRYRPLNVRSVAQLVGARCRGSVQTLGRELKLIGSMIDPNPRRRNSPMDLLESSVFAEDKLPQVAKPQAAQLLEEFRFQIGSKVQYWSETARQWVDVVVMGIAHDHEGNCYHIALEGQPEKVHKCMPARKVRENKSAAVDESLQVPVQQVPDVEGDDEPKDGLNAKVVMYPNQEDAQLDTRGIYLELSAPQQKATSKRQLLVTTVMTCLHPAKCHDFEVYLICPGEIVVKLEFISVNKAEKKVHMGTVLRPDDGRLGMSCKLKAEADVSTDGQVTWTKQQSASKHLTLASASALR